LLVPDIAATVGGAMSAMLTASDEVPQAFVAVKERFTEPVA
jgi:hypothetical protein